jgi:aminoglycoside phosphotransferase (APT) family kinase protein
MKADEIESALEPALGKLWETWVSVENVRRVPGGSSRETWSLEAHIAREGAPADVRKLALRNFQREMPQALSARQEFALLTAAKARGVPVPEPVFLAEGLTDTDFYLMEFVEGETVGRRLIKDEAYAHARSVMTGQLGRVLATIHRIPLTPEVCAALPPAPTADSPALAELDRFEAAYRAITPDPHPAYELALRWLRRCLPPPRELVFTHGDYRVGNVIFGPEGLRSVIDWEGAHLGDPMQDLGWICVRSWRFGGSQPVGGIGSPEEFFQAYEAAGGAKVDPESVRWWEVFGNLRWGLVTLSFSRQFLDGVNRDLEPASIGRRTAETEWEVLRLLEED